MAKHRTGNLVDLKLSVSAEEEQRFAQYIQRNKFTTPRLALMHLLHLADSTDVKPDSGEEKNGSDEHDVVKETGKGEAAKTVGGRRGKKGAEEVLTPDGDVKNSHGNEHGVSTAEAAEQKETAKEDDGKKTKGRRGKKETKETPTVIEEDGKSGDNADLSDEGAQNTKQAVRKRAPAKKAAARKGKQAVVEGNGNGDATFNVVDDHTAHETETKQVAPKKSAKGKTAVTAIAEELESEGGEGDAIDLQKGKSPELVDTGDRATEPKKRRGKAEAASNGDTKKGGKRKPNTKAQEASTPPEQAESTAAKPKRGRAAKQNVNYAEADVTE